MTGESRKKGRAFGERKKKRGMIQKAKKVRCAGERTRREFQRKEPHSRKKGTTGAAQSGTGLSGEAWNAVLETKNSVPKGRVCWLKEPDRGAVHGKVRRR